MDTHLQQLDVTAEPHLQEAGEVVLSLGSDASAGLTRGEAAARLHRHGPNELPSAARAPGWAILAAQFKNVLIVILLVAIGLSFALGHTVEAIAIAAIALFSVVLGFVQEYRAERALEALRRMSAPTATVVRGGEEQEVPSRELVPGDVVVLGSGDIVPADARLLEAMNLRVDEAALTGESSPIGKHTDVLPEGTVALGDRRNLVYSSTAVTYGRGRAVVFATGSRTEIGQIGSLLSEVRHAKTPLEVNLERVGRWLARAALAVVLLVIAFGLARGMPFVEMLIFGIALAVAVVPEALPAVVTISLAIGAQRMARRNALIRRLPTAETLGSTTVICSDKTGTLTTGEMTVLEVLAADGTWGVDGVGYAPQGGFSRGGERQRPSGPISELLATAALCTDAHLVRGDDGRWRVRGDPTEGAIVTVAAKAGLTKVALEDAEPRVEEIAFSSERKRMTTLHGRGGALADCVESVEVFARVSPADKLRVVTALQGRDQVVAMTGDGVNDAPALKKADIGVAMGVTGTDVSKEAAAMVLADDNFASIVAAVEEGRAIYDNIKKYLTYLLSSNVGEIALMAVAMLLGLPIPLTAVQILYVNLATDGLPALALAVDSHAPDLMRRGPLKPGQGVFSRPVVVLMLLGGLWSALVNVSLFAWALASGFALSEAMTMTFVSLVLIQFFKAYSFRSERRSVFSGTFENRWLNRAVAWELLLLGLVVYVPFLRGPFGTFPLPLVDWLIVVGAAISILPVLEAAKWVVRRGGFG